jgi:heterodisulfide reductase subunit B
MPETPVSEAIRDQTEVLAELIERLDETLEHLTEHVCCVCRHYYGTRDHLEVEEQEP